MGFNPSKADPYVWMRPAEYNLCYEYIAVYVDDIAISAKDAKKITDDLQLKHLFKLKGTGSLTLQGQYGSVWMTDSMYTIICL